MTTSSFYSNDKSRLLVIFGLEGIADVAWHYFSSDSNYQVVAFTVDAPYMNCHEKNGLPVVKFEDVEKIYPPNKYDMFIAMSYRKLNQPRTEKYFQAKEKGYTLASYVNSHAICNSNNIGENCFILENVVIQPFSVIGNNVFIWSGSHIGHHSTIADNCFITSQCVVAGNVYIGDYTFIGINASIRDGITVGEKSILGAGTLLLANAPDNSVYGAVGTPKAPFDSWRIAKI